MDLNGSLSIPDYGIQQQQLQQLLPSWQALSLSAADQRVLFVASLAVTWLSSQLSAALLHRCYRAHSSKTKAQGGDLLEDGVRRLSRDLGMTPVRMALVGLNFFCLKRFLSFSSISEVEFDQAQISWIVLAAGYTSELTGYVSELRGGGGIGLSYAVSLAHHLVAMAVAVFVNRRMPCALSSGGRHWLRLLSGVAVFAVALGGMLTSLLRILYLHDRLQQAETPTGHRQPAARPVRWAAFGLTWALTATIACAWWEIVSRYHVHSEDMYGFLGGPMVAAAIAVAFFLFWVQWKWVVLWHAKMQKLWRPQRPVQHLSMQQMPVLCVAGGSLVGLISVACSAAQSMAALRVAVSMPWA